MLFQIFGVFSSMLWIFVTNTVSLLWFVYVTLATFVAILALPIYIKMYLLPSDTSITCKEQYVFSVSCCLAFCCIYHTTVSVVAMTCFNSPRQALDKHHRHIRQLPSFSDHFI